MPIAHAVCLLGFSEFEHQALSAHFRLAADRSPAYTLVPQLNAARFLVIDADSSGWAGRVVQAGRAGDTVFVGAKAPEGALAHLGRPIDAMQVLRELDAALQLLEGRPGAKARQRAASMRAKTNPHADTAPTPLPAASQWSELAALFPDRLEAQPQGKPPVDTGFDALLVDDSDIALRFLELKLADLGIRSRCVTDSDAALVQLARHRIAYVFLDVELGAKSRMDGLALCQQIKRNAPADNPPGVAMVSAHTSPTDRVRGSLAGCDAYLAKPLVTEELAAVVAQLRSSAALAGQVGRS